MAGGNGFSSTNSSQQLMNADTDSVTASGSVISSIEGDDGGIDVTKRPSSQNSHQYNGVASITYSEWFAVGVLCFVNLINYMDRFTIAGVLPEIEAEFHMDDIQSGLLQTTFVMSYMIFAPAFGYLGDRHSRRWIMMLGVALWSGTTLLGSFMGTYKTFIIFRALVGIGEASYSTIAPTIISDLFINDLRSKMLAMFYFAIPVGSGFGYIVGAKTAHALDNWRWALRVTPLLGLIAVVLIFLMKEPVRGQHESSSHLRTSSYKEDLIDILRNPSFMLSTLGFTCVAFVTGALAWWGPKFMYNGLRLQKGDSVSLDDVSVRFGVIAMLAGIIGVPLGAYLTQKLRKKSHRYDPIICACGLLISAPLLVGAMLLVNVNEPIAYGLVFVGQVALNLNWAIVADILLYVVLPTRRSTAEAFQILISHAFGDAGSPYLIGLISESLKRVINPIPAEYRSVQNVTTNLQDNIGTTDEDILTQFRSLQYALFATSFVEILGGVFFLLTAMYIIRDKKKVEQAISGSQVNDTVPSQTLPEQRNPYSPAIGDFRDSIRD